MSSSSQRMRPLPVIDLGLLLGPNFRRRNAAPAAASNAASNQSAMDKKPKATGSDSASQPEIKVCDDSKTTGHASENDKAARLPRVSLSSAGGTARKLPVERRKHAIHDDQSAKLVPYMSILDRECPASDDSEGDEMTLTEMKTLVNHKRGPASITATASNSKQEKRLSESANANGEAPIALLSAKKNDKHSAKKRGKRSITSPSTESKGATKLGAPANDETSESLPPKKQKGAAKKSAVSVSNRAQVAITASDIAPSSLNRCIPLSFVPNTNSSTVQVTATVSVPSWTGLANFPEHCE